MDKDLLLGFLAGFGVKVFLEELKHRREEVIGARTMMAHARSMHEKASAQLDEGQDHFIKWSILLTTGWVTFMLLILTLVYLYIS